ncbi:MAG: BolA/IbaG family iron-sulfur metabolism protein [Granulosicoccus sp.]|nr:BolA/IbaG family iron-sulfur metabolism protein [Granulosicoccus sp.]
MLVASQINDLLVEGLNPVRLDIDNESHMHNVPEGAESHFKLVVVSQQFDGKNLVSRHRMVNHLLADLLKGEIHALSMHTYTAEEWEQRGGEVPNSPPCLGGKAAESAKG